MRKSYYSLLGTIIVLAFLGAPPVQAVYWQNAGGNAAEVANTAQIWNGLNYHYPESLHVILGPGRSTSIICPVQVRSANPVEAFSVNFSTTNVYSRITQIEVWDGFTRVVTRTPPSPAAWSGPMKTARLYPGGSRTFANGVTIVLRISQVSTSSGTFDIYGYGAGTTYNA